MRKTPLRPGTKPLARTSALRSGPTRLARGQPLKAKGGSRFPKRRDAAYCRWIRTLACLVDTLPCLPTGELACFGVVQPAHVTKTRGAGAYDRGEVVPPCVKHHAEQEGRTARFNAKYNVNLGAVARRLAAET